MNPICIQDLTTAKVLAAPTSCQATANLNIGTLAPSAAYDVFISNIGSQTTIKYDIVTDGAGLATISLQTNALFFNGNNLYSLHVVANNDDIADYVLIDNLYVGFVLYFWRSNTTAPTTQNIQVV
jgi:predicted metalloprotease with PDZ domain